MLDSKSSRLKERATVQYRDKNKQVKRSARNDKRQYVEQLAEKAERAAEQKDMRTVYQITRKLQGNHGNTQDLLLKAVDGIPSQKRKSNFRGGENTLKEILNRADPSGSSLRHQENMVYICRNA